jgi:hypothetical protein
MGWKEDLPETVQGWDEVKNSETPEAFFEQVSNMRSSLGQSIRIPGEDASVEAKTAFQAKLTEKVPGLVQLPGDDDADALSAFYKTLGRPEDVAGYELPEKDAEGVELSVEFTDHLRKQAHEAGLSKKQFKQVLKGITDLESAAAKNRGTKQAEGVAELKLAWGQAFEEKAAMAELIRKQYFPFAPEGLNAGVDSIKAFAALGAQMAGESQGNLTVGQQKGAMTPNDAMMKISEIMGNKEHPYWKRRDPAHSAARARMTELNKFAYPG